jgi:hypothetical protein
VIAFEGAATVRSGSRDPDAKRIRVTAWITDWDKTETKVREMEHPGRTTALTVAITLG